MLKLLRHDFSYRLAKEMFRHLIPVVENWSTMRPVLSFGAKPRKEVVKCVIFVVLDALPHYFWVVVKDDPVADRPLVSCGYESVGFEETLHKFSLTVLVLGEAVADENDFVISSLATAINEVNDPGHRFQVVIDVWLLPPADDVQVDPVRFAKINHLETGLVETLGWIQVCLQTCFFLEPFNPRGEAVHDGQIDIEGNHRPEVDGFVEW